MELKRYNVFNQIHKGLKVMLYDTALALQQTDFTTGTEAESTLAKLEHVLAAFDMHAEHENEFILPHATKYNLEVIHGFEQEHINDAELAAGMRKDMEALKISADPEEIRSLGHKLYFDFNDFLAFNLYHMVKEEKLINKILWDHYTDDQIREMEGAIVASIPPEVLFQESTWMMKGMSNNEIMQWLLGMKLHAPEEVFRMFLKMAEEVLDETRWHSIHTSLTEGVLVH